MTAGYSEADIHNQRGLEPCAEQLDPSSSGNTWKAIASQLICRARKALVHKDLGLLRIDFLRRSALHEELLTYSGVCAADSYRDVENEFEFEK